MKTENELIPIEQTEVTWDTINEKGRELGQAGVRLFAAGEDMVKRAIEVGEDLEAKYAAVERAGGSWPDSLKLNWSYSRQSADNYRKLWKNRADIANALALGKINSIRQALAIIAKEPGMAAPMLPGMNPEAEIKARLQAGGETPQQIAKAVGVAAEVVESISRGMNQPKTEGIFTRLWSIFREPAKTPEPERKSFLLHTAHACRVAKEQGWEVPGVTIEMEEVK